MNENKPICGDLKIRTILRFGNPDTGCYDREYEIMANHYIYPDTGSAELAQKLTAMVQRTIDEIYGETEAK